MWLYKPLKPGVPATEMKNISKGKTTCSYSTAISVIPDKRKKNISILLICGSQISVQLSFFLATRQIPTNATSFLCVVTTWINIKKTNLLPIYIYIFQWCQGHGLFGGGGSFLFGSWNWQLYFTKQSGCVCTRGRSGWVRRYLVSDRHATLVKVCLCVCIKPHPRGKKAACMTHAHVEGYYKEAG